MAVAYSRRGGGSVTHYLNGAVTTLASSSASLSTRPSTIGPIDTAYVGRSVGSSGLYLDCYLQDFRVYDTALR